MHCNFSVDEDEGRSKIKISRPILESWPNHTASPLACSTLSEDGERHLNGFSNRFSGPRRSEEKDKMLKMKWNTIYRPIISKKRSRYAAYTAPMSFVNAKFTGRKRIPPHPVRRIRTTYGPSKGLSFHLEPLPNLCMCHTKQCTVRSTQVPSSDNEIPNLLFF